MNLNTSRKLKLKFIEVVLQIVSKCKKITLMVTVKFISVTGKNVQNVQHVQK